MEPNEHLTHVVAGEEADKRFWRIFETVHNRLFPPNLAGFDPGLHILVKR